MNFSIEYKNINSQVFNLYLKDNGKIMLQINKYKCTLFNE